MTRPLATRLTWLALICLIWTSADSLAARVSTQERNGYQRVNFTFDAPTRLNASKNGTTLTLKFSSPLKQSAADVGAALGNYARSTTLSADGKTLTVIMAKPYRTRNFVSGSTVGIDLIGEAEGEQPEEILTTKKPEPTKPVEKPVAKKPEPKKPEVKTAEKKPEAPILTTKEPEAKPAPAPAVKEPEKKLEPAPVVEKKPEPVAPSPTTAATEPAPTPATPAPEPQKPAPQVVVKKGPFVVTVRQQANSSTINFPFSERTAAAVFERGNTIWIVFSRSADMNLMLLKSILPKSVTEATQYSYPGSSVLRLATDGSIHASAENLNSTYEWNVTLAATPTEPANRIGVTVDTIDHKTRLVAAAFDVAEPLKFYDPAVGDHLLVIPSYENKHGVPHSRTFPEIELLASNQGVAMITTRDDLTTSSGRLGVVVESPKGLAISENLAVMSGNKGPVLGLNSGVLLPYNEWFVPPDKFRATLIARQQALRSATKDSRAENLYALATLYLGQGMGSEANGYLDLIAANEPEFYKARKLALLSTAAHALEGHIDAASTALAAPELADVKEADLWREYLSLYVSKPSVVQKILQENENEVAKPFVAPPSDTTNLAADSEDVAELGTEDSAKPVAPPSRPLMRFLKYNRSFVRFYPPRIRQMLASAAADAYVANGLEEKALAAFDTLNRDEIIGPLRHQAEYVLALQSAKSKKPEQATELLERLVKQSNDPFSRARARATLAMMQLQAGKKTVDETTDELESIRISWRGDAVEIDILKTLVKLYTDAKQYDNALRTLKNLTEEFPGDADYLTTSAETSDLFEKLYLGGLADEMPPLKSLSLFYEFRDLTPIGDKGDLIIQKLADRLAAFDLIDRATQLLENQVNFRLAGEARSRVGARLALLYLFNHQPKEALKVLEVTNYGSNPVELQRQRLQLTAQALSAVGRHTDALNLIYNDTSDAGQLLKMDILWAAQDWPNVVTTGEDILSKRADLTKELTPTETEILLKLALGYSFQGDYNQLRYLKDYYAALVPESGYKKIFEFITNDTTPLDKEDSAMLTEQISRTEGFMSLFKAKIAAGKLSEAVQ